MHKMDLNGTNNTICRRFSACQTAWAESNAVAANHINDPLGLEIRAEKDSTKIIKMSCVLRVVIEHTEYSE